MGAAEADHPNFKKVFVVFLLEHRKTRWGNHFLFSEQLLNKDLSFKNPKLITATCKTGQEEKEGLYENLRHYKLILWAVMEIFQIV